MSLNKDKSCKNCSTRKRMVRALRKGMVPWVGYLYRKMCENCCIGTPHPRQDNWGSDR